jgi:transposase
LVDLRDDFVTEAKRHSSRLRWLLHDLDPDLQPALRSLSNNRSRTALKTALEGMTASTLVRVCQDLLELLSDLYARAGQLRRELAALVKTNAPQLTEIPGCGVLTAATILAEVGQIKRFRTDARLARYGGVAPLEASSGRSQRHRLSRQSNRQLNYALHIIAVTQVRVHPPARQRRNST